ncbi:UNVERIFIED_ORG: hypothetical protein GGI57_000432 [Rhizobium aethiopicum]
MLDKVSVAVSFVRRKINFHMTRCVAACERMGFVVVESYPRSDLVIKTNEVDGVSETECSIE